MARNGTFEIPAEMREFAEKSVEQAKLAFDTFVSAAQQAVTTVETQAASARTGVKEASELAMRFAEDNVNSSFDFAQKLLKAKDPQEITSLHSEYVKSQIAKLTEQAKEFSKKAAKMAGHSIPD